MAKTFSKRIAQLVKEAKSASKDGKIRSSFSRKFYNDVAEAVLNDPDYEFDQIKVRGGEPTTVTTKPSRVFREKLFGPVMSTLNVDAEDAKKFIDEYQFTQAQASTIYDLASAINWEYMNTGKILRMPSKADFTGSIFLKEVPEHDRINPRNGAVTKNKKHRVLVKRSVTPAWLKEKK